MQYAYQAPSRTSYETTMELCDPRSGRFMMCGHQSMFKREEFIEAVLLKLHEVVVAIEFTAAVTANARIFKLARDARHAMDGSDLWRRP